MASTSNRATEEVPFNLVEDKIISSSNSSLGDQEKTEDAQPISEGQVGNDKSESLTALLQVFGAFFLMFNSWYVTYLVWTSSTVINACRGIANTFGAYQIYYEAALLKNQTPSNISWIGSIQAFLLLIVGGFVTGPIFDAGYLRALVLVGSALAVFGMMMTSICKEYWQVILAQGVVTGIGMGCMMLPSVAVMPQYFKSKRAFATGVAASGSSLGKLLPLLKLTF